MRAAAAAAVLLVAFGQAAEARVVTLRWTHPSPADVDGFRVHIGTSSGSYTNTVNAGRPSASGGVFSFDIVVGDYGTAYVALSAYGAGFLESNLSAEKVFPPPTTQPPPTQPPPTDPTPTEPPPSEPPADASWSQDFQTIATGSYVPGWRDTGADNSLAENDLIFGVVDAGGNRLLATSTNDVNVHSHYMGTGSEQWSSYELTGRMRTFDLSGGVGVTAYSQYPRSDVYYRLRSHQGRPFEMSPHPDGANVSCTPADTGVVPIAKTWYLFRLRVTPGTDANAIRAKVWPAGSAEPSGWQTTCVDDRADRPRQGTVGVWAKGPGTQQWDELAVVPIGGSAPAPPPDGKAPPPPVLLPIE